MAIKNVALLGADGKLGPAMLHALLAHNFKVTVLKRASSKSPNNYPANVSVSRIPDDFDIDAVSTALKGQDAVIATIKGNQTDLQVRLAEASIRAGVQRFIPADFGSADSSSAWAQELVPLFKRKTELRGKLTELSERNPSFTWTAIVSGHFADWSLKFLHLYVKEKRAEVLDDGTVACSASTLARIGEATAKVLLHPEETANRMIYVQSFCASQMDVVRAFERATGEKWKVDQLDSRKYARERKEKADGGDLEAVEDLVWLLGTLDANWESKENFAMKTLGLKDEGLDAVVRRMVVEGLE